MRAISKTELSPNNATSRWLRKGASPEEPKVWSTIGREFTIATKSEPDGRGLRRARWWPSARTSA